MQTFGPTDNTEEYGTPHPDARAIEGVVVVGYDPAAQMWLALRWNGTGTIWLAGGGKEQSESYEQAAVRELREETGFTTFTDQIQLGGPIISHYYNDKKAMFRQSYAFAFLFMLDSRRAGTQALEAHEDFAVVWLDYKSLRAAIEQTGGGVEHWLAVLVRAHDYVTRVKE